MLIAIALGVVIGYFYPDLGKALKPLGDGFIALIKMMIAPVIFCTVVHGISSMGDLKRVGRVGLKSLIYFETVSTVALAVGLLVGEILQPGHGFNIDGTNTYMTLATLFLAQATNTHLTIWQELGILGIAMITSKGASGVTGAGFITLAATLSIVPDIPIQSIAILVGIDKFMSECRALTNLIGNGVACVVISISEGELDRVALHQTMAHPLEIGEALEPGASVAS